MERERTGDALSARIAMTLRRRSALTPLILFMGFIGATLRYLLEIALPSQGSFPFATLVINIFGCFVLELINQYVGRRMHLPAPLVKSLGVGLVGAFTTLSAFSTECLGFLHAGRFGLAALYIGITVATTFLATLAGHGACRALERRRFLRATRRRAAIHERHARSASADEAAKRREQAANRYLEEWQKREQASAESTRTSDGHSEEGGRR